MRNDAFRQLSVVHFEQSDSPGRAQAHGSSEKVVMAVLGMRGAKGCEHVHKYAQC